MFESIFPVQSLRHFGSNPLIIGGGIVAWGEGRLGRQGSFHLGRRRLRGYSLNRGLGKVWGNIRALPLILKNICMFYLFLYYLVLRQFY